MECNVSGLFLQSIIFFIEYHVKNKNILDQ